MKSVVEEGGRRYPRIRYDAASVLVRYVKSGPSIPARLLDISRNGCLIAVAMPLPVSTSDVIETRLDLNSLVLHVLGLVCHADEANQTFGIEFHSISEKDQCDLELFVQYFAAVHAN